MNTFAKYILTALICILALGQFVQVITRYILEVPVMGLEEMLIYPTIWLYILGAVNASREDHHIRANVLEMFLTTERAHTVLAIISEVISLIIGLWLLSWVWDFTKYAARVWKETPTLYFPTFYYDAALFVGLTVMLLFTAGHLVRHIQSVLGGSARHG